MHLASVTRIVSSYWEKVAVKLLFVSSHFASFALVGADVMGTLECNGIDKPVTEVPVETGKIPPEDCMSGNKVGMCAHAG